ncbi:MAG: signal peptidase I [Proteobacteria bacterium]|nr:signal peptidase I [Pseudomonadota bacterium]
MDHHNSGGFKETVKTVLYAILIALGVRTVAYEPFNIPSGSMIPTLLVGDYLFVSKFSYGYSRYSLPFSLPLIPGRIFFTEPERGDVMVFKLPSDNKTDYIKRIVGLPGDTVQLKQGILHINGKPVKRERVDDFVVRDSLGNYIRTPRYLETLPGGRQHYILEVTDNSVFDNTSLYTVPEGHYFAMGDNRDRSRDSRFLNDVGYIPRQNLIGRAEFMFFSVNGTVYEIWKWAKTVRFERIFQGIE